MAKTTLAISAVASALATTYGAVQQDQAQRKSRGMQKTAQQQAQNTALKQENANEEAMRRATKKPPDLTELLASQSMTTKPGTMLTGGAPTNSYLGA